MASLARLCRGIGVTAVLCAAGCTSTLSRATSPDGRWMVEVRGSRGPFGSVEVTMESEGPGGRKHPAHVIDLCSSWIEAKKRYGTIDIDDERAVVHDRVERFDDVPGVRGESAGMEGSESLAE